MNIRKTPTVRTLLPSIRRLIIVIVVYLQLSLTAVTLVSAQMTGNNGGTTGTYQRFEGGSIYSSSLGTFAVIGNLDVVYRANGSTGTYGFPLGETYQQNGEMCQKFELGVLCEGGFVPRDVLKDFIDRVVFHFNNNIPCLFGGETPAGVDCRGLALLSMREVTDKTAGDNNCDRLGTCDPAKHIPSTGADGLAKNYYPYMLAFRAEFPYTSSSGPNIGGLTIYDWQNDNAYDHINIVVDMDNVGNRVWMYSNADCATGDHLRLVYESDLKIVKHKIFAGETLVDIEQNLLPKLVLLDNSEEERDALADYMSSINLPFSYIDKIIKTTSLNVAWSDSLLY